MHSLMTGGAGFIGSHVARELLSLGHEVTIVDDLSGGFVENVPTGAAFVRGSVADASFVAELFRRSRFQYVYHLAAYAAEGLSHFIRHFNYTSNVLGSINVINEAIKNEVQCFVFTSSIAVYGAGQVPMCEEQIPQPEDPYGIGKYAIELDLKSAHKMFGMNYIIFRPHNVYGENQNIGDRYRNVIGIFMNQVMRGGPLTVFGDGLQTRAFSHIDDVAPCIARSVHVPRALNQVFNIGADEPCTVLEVANAVAKAFNAEPAIRFLPPRKEVTHAFSNHDKARRILECVPGVMLDAGVRRMAEWARRHGARQTRPFANIEIVRGLPPNWAKDYSPPLP
jgi:UDP-glucose 4-epimerase